MVLIGCGDFDEGDTFALLDLKEECEIVIYVLWGRSICYQTIKYGSIKHKNIEKKQRYNRYAGSMSDLQMRSSHAEDPLFLNLLL